MSSLLKVVLIRKVCKPSWLGKYFSLSLNSPHLDNAGESELDGAAANFPCHDLIQNFVIQFSDDVFALWKVSYLLYEYILGWNDFVLFEIFVNGHDAANKVYFYESNSKNRRIWPLLLSFSKNHRYIYKFANTCLLQYFEEQSPRGKFEKRLPKWTNWFLTWSRINIFF